MGKRSEILITKRVVDALQPHNTAWDCQLRGFHVRMQNRDRVYGLQKKINGKDSYVRIGLHGSPWTPDMARRKALSLLADIEKGIDPRENRKGMNVSELCERYLREHAEPHKAPGSVEGDRSLIKNHVKPLLGAMRVAVVKKTDIQKFQLQVRDGETAADDPITLQKAQKGGAAPKGGPGVANRCLSLLSKMFNLAEEWELRPQNSNPVKGVTRFQERKIERFLSKAELASLGAALRASEEIESPHAIAAIRLLILTGARSSEVLTLRWDHVDLERGLLNLPNSKTGQKTIRLSQPAIDILTALPRVNGNPFVVVGCTPNTRLKSLDSLWRRVCKAADLKTVRIHDIRHTFASVGVASGVPLIVVGKLLGHARAETTERYAHLANDHVAGANAGIGVIIDEMMKSPRVSLVPDLPDPATA